MKLRRYAAGFLAAVLFVLFSVFPAFAEPHTFGELDAYLVETASDAMLADEAASIMPFSSLGAVTNTVNLTDVRFYVYYNDASSGVEDVLKYGNFSIANKRFQFSIQLDQGDEILRFGFQLPSSALPSPGTYKFAFDMGSDISFEYLRAELWSAKDNLNAGQQMSSTDVTFYSSSGDVLIPDTLLNITNVARMNVQFYPAADTGLYNLSGSCAFRFLVAPSDPDAPSTAGSDTSTQDWENSISSGLGDISSSLDSVDESLQYISNSQNLIIQGIDNVILHISDQLYAFWDQLYNLIHVPTYSMLQQILQAIHDLDINVDVNLDDLTDTLEENHAEQIANDNQIADDIQNGYDSSGLASSDQKLDAALEDQAEKEDQVMEQISGPLESFTFTNPISQYLDTFLVLGDFLQDLYTASGALKDVINLSFLMGIALMVVGLYRFKGGN